jgi:CheY-like chemotaxis protein
MKELRILIVEDDVVRLSWFDQCFSRHQRDVTDRVQTATQWLAQREYDLIFLDHDLTEEHYFEVMADDGLTGYVVAEWLAENPQQQSAARIIIHSLNYPGSDRMLAVLLRSGRDALHIPFYDLPSLFPALLS